ncbi:MAG: MarR family transcriptional regulator [Lactobacillales bacterium]|jgi:DNA-binding MarR family transcriptional regulator|nr:MarR family transcriptional regulator [Lactobacillales bacterium]
MLDQKLEIFADFFRVANRLTLLMDREVPGLTAKQWYVLKVLKTEFDTPPTLGELAKEAQTSYQNVKQIVVKLEQKGFVKLEQDPNDKRAKRVILNAKSTQWAHDTDEKTSHFRDEILDTFDTQEIENLKTNIEKIINKIEEYNNTEVKQDD